MYLKRAVKAANHTVGYIQLSSRKYFENKATSESEINAPCIIIIQIVNFNTNNQA